MVQGDQQLCIDCHDAKHIVQTDTVELDLISDFGDDHPEFRLTLFTPVIEATETSWLRQRVAAGDLLLREQSNLLFNHKEHLDRDGIETPDGKVVMKCDDCHVEDAAGALMRRRQCLGPGSIGGGASNTGYWQELYCLPPTPVPPRCQRGLLRVSRNRIPPCQ